MKTLLFKGSSARLAAVLLALPAGAALALEFAIQPFGYSGFGVPSTDGIFSVSGGMEPVERVDMKGGEFSVSGAFRSSVADANLTVPEVNLLPFGDAEGLENADGNTAIVPPGWTVEGYLIAAPWGAPGGWPTFADPGPPDRGQSFFSGGPDNAVTTATIHIDLPSSPARIDSGRVVAELSGWFGGFLGQNDMAALIATFLDPQDSELQTTRVGGITADQRQGHTGLLRDSAIVPVPTGARRVKVVLEMRRSANNGFNDGYADNLRLVLRDPIPPGGTQLDVPTISGPDLKLSFPSAIGRTYGLESRTGLDEGSWTTIPGLTATGTGEKVELVLSNAFGLQRTFYRLRVRP